MFKSDIHHFDCAHYHRKDDTNADITTVTNKMWVWTFLFFCLHSGNVLCQFESSGF